MNSAAMTMGSLLRFGKAPWLPTPNTDRTMTVDEARAELLELKWRVEQIRALFDLNTGEVAKAD
jgi:hypothetical protein